MGRSVGYLLLLLMVAASSAIGGAGTPTGGTAYAATGGETATAMTATGASEVGNVRIPENFVLIRGGQFQMGSPDSEAWRGADETRHAVTVGDFRLSRHELTQAEFLEVTGRKPSAFSGPELPVENVSWLDAIAYCNARSQKEGLTPAYSVSGRTVTWDRSANGYRLPTEAEWEYACRAGTETPFNTEKSIGADEANYYGHYPYLIEENYFSQGNLEAKPGQYRQTTVAPGGFPPNEFGLHDMHGNVGEWVWDYYGEYGAQAQSDPAGPASGTLRVYRGGGWNDFAKNTRSAYRAAMAAEKGSFNVGIRLALNAVPGAGLVTGSEARPEKAAGAGQVLIAYYSWGGNTRAIAGMIRERTGADLFEIEPARSYSGDYNTVLSEAQRDQRAQARPELAKRVDDMGRYDVILLGYPNWWASIPMPIASFLEEYDFSGKTIIAFCSHGGGRFGQSLTAIAKLAPNARMGEALSVHYSGGSALGRDIGEWLAENGVKER
jgi:formylglycine-generating enzyme required for sulfatase activity/flavodoxin